MNSKEIGDACYTILSIKYLYIFGHPLPFYRYRGFFIGRHQHPSPPGDCCQAKP